MTEYRTVPTWIPLTRDYSDAELAAMTREATQAAVAAVEAAKERYRMTDPRTVTDESDPPEADGPDVPDEPIVEPEETTDG